jgi:hypothetical protein
MDIEIRIYELEQDGKMHELSSRPADYYGGSCPNVGDTLCTDFTALGVCFYTVQRRYFVEGGGAIGWAVIVRRLDPAPQQLKVFETWKEDTEFWREIDEREREEKLQALLKSVKASETAPIKKSKQRTATKVRTSKRAAKAKRP